MKCNKYKPSAMNLTTFHYQLKLFGQLQPLAGNYHKQPTAVFSALQWLKNKPEGKNRRKTNATPKTAPNKQNIQNRSRLWRGIKTSRPKNSGFANRKRYALANPKFASNLLVFQLSGGGQWLVCAPCQSLEAF